MSRKQIDLLRDDCTKEGLNLREVFRRAQVPETTIQNWDRKEPDAFTTLKKLKETISLMVEEKEGVHVNLKDAKFFENTDVILNPTAVPVRD